MRTVYQFCFIVAGFLLMVSCEKENLVVVGDNPPYSTFNISDIKIENYVNRLYIDIIGREPLDDELVYEVNRLKAAGLDRITRDSIIYQLMTDTTYKENEFSYKAAYVQNLYNLSKVRCIEGVPDADLQERIGVLRGQAFKDSLEGNMDGYFAKQYQIARNKATLNSRQALYDGHIDYHQMFAFMIDNTIYDVINMNTFNFVRATFDELLWRLPTEQEFDKCFDMVEFNQPEEIFGELGSSKHDYIRILTESNEMFEGMVIWCYQVFMSRPPTAGELVTILPVYLQTKDINWVIAQILVTDEYANFR